MIGDQPDVAAVAAITAVRATHRLGTFTTEADAARAAITTADVQLALVDELRHSREANAVSRMASRIVSAMTGLPFPDSAADRAEPWEPDELPEALHAPSPSAATTTSALIRLTSATLTPTPNHLLLRRPAAQKQVVSPRGDPGGGVVAAQVRPGARSALRRWSA